MKRFICIMATVLLFGCGMSPAPTQNSAGNATLSISCSTILNNTDAPEDLPENGMILGETSIEFAQGSTAFDCLKDITQIHNISLRYTSAPFCYIQEIGGISEFDYGNMSGWLYKVNGESPNVGIGDYKMQDGDRIEILYSCDFGNDL